MKTIKNQRVFKSCILVMSFLFPMLTFGQYHFETYCPIIVKKKGADAIELSSYVLDEKETAENGKAYARICNISGEGKSDFTLVKLPYGVLTDEKKIYVYDFEKKVETVAFDFTLSAGDRFSTMNGMEWIVTEACDTTILLKNGLKDTSRTLRLLKVKNIDGETTDQWLEEFGSFSNHLMIRDMKDVEY